MKPDQSPETLERMESMLRRCRRRIIMAKVSVRLREGLELFLKCLLAIAVVFLVARVVAYAMDATVAFNWVHVLAVAAAVGVVTFGLVLWRGMRGSSIHTSHAAERLDLSQSTHNRIATAIALLRDGDDSRFAKAAIHDGFEYLEKLQAEEPHVEAATSSWRRKGAFLAASLVMVVIGQLLEGDARPTVAGDPATPGAVPVAGVDQQPEIITPDSKIEPKARVTDNRKPQPTGEVAAREDDPGDSDKGKRPEPGAESQSEGPSGQHASGKARSSQSSSNSASAASGAGVKAEPGSTEPGKRKKPRVAKKQLAGQPKVDQKNEKGGSINARGSSGGGSMRTAQNEWSSKIKAKSSESDDFEQEEEPDEEMDPDKQRMGAQPALKNRTSRVSRELSLAMGSGLSKDMMKGRGGPSAQKKSRGTATMIMGVPVPGFVKGRLLPGPTKSTQEEVEPTVREGEYAAASTLKEARPEETLQERFRPLAAIGTRARDYLIKYHTEHENKRNAAAAAATE